MSNAVSGQGTALATPAPPLASRLLAPMRSQPLLPLMLAGATALAIIVAMLLWARAPEYRVLFANLDEADGGRIISELEKRAVPYRLSEGGQALLVPAEQLHTLRLQLAEQGLPQGGNVGFELLDKQAFGVSQFAEQINFQRGLEGELARSIESLGPVSRARVHLAMAKQSVFVREREPARASVVLSLQPGRELGEPQVNAIAHLVSSSVPGLSIDAVTVVDQSGRLLSRQGSARDLDGTQLDYIDEVERSYQRRIENILAPILGAQNVRAQVVAQIDFASREQTAERYGPNQQPGEAAVRSQQLSENLSGGTEPARGVPGALTNSPPNPPPAPATGDKTQTGDAASGEAGQAAAAEKSPTALSRDNTINYEIDRSVEHVQYRRGSVQRLSAAVVVNYRNVIKDGQSTREPLSQEDLARIDRLVRQAMGFTDARGDQLEIMNSPFADIEVADQLEWWKTPEFYNLVASLSRYLLVAFIALLLWLMVLRPLKRRHQERLAAEAAARAEATEAAQAALEASRVPALAVEESHRRDLRRKSPIYEQNLQSLREMAKEDPRMVAMIIRGWMKKEEK
ncbi:flagellar basal-body MS-ring/collar protein FliF [Azotobacter salinestris]|uniref:flagellar basal-body MS-ring/collar protein FliF n=1 Tax=Azotobacter salinestris TaxID=69964 RepID=UPI001266E17A|nr:flagellar basal-body MS-ring/collar protein FliF [Azotobacter salinestris]